MVIPNHYTNVTHKVRRNPEDMGGPRSGPGLCTQAVLCNSHSNWIEWSTIHNGNRTEYSPIQSVIIRVIKKIGRPRSNIPVCPTSMITDRIGRHKALSS